MYYNPYMNINTQPNYYPQPPQMNNGAAADNLAMLRQPYMNQQPTFNQGIQPQQNAGNYQNISNNITTYYRIWVSKNEVEDYPVAPNSAVDLWDKDEPLIYMKKADASGKPSIEIYELVRRDNANNNQISTLTVEYATKQEVNELSEKLNNFIKKADKNKSAKQESEE